MEDIPNVSIEARQWKQLYSSHQVCKGGDPAEMHKEKPSRETVRRVL
jgi:hypothetical protein